MPDIVTVYCPICQRGYSGKTHDDAINVMEEHLERHDIDLPSTERSDDEV